MSGVQVQETPTGWIHSRTLSSGIAQSQTFNSRYQLAGIAASVAGDSVMNLAYGYAFGAENNIGLIRTRTDALQPEHSTQYRYDDARRMDRVTAATGAW